MFFKNMLCGAAVGVAMIIPGVSGGTIAVLLGIYDKLIDSVTGLRKNFKESFLFLLPFALGAVAAFAAMYFPLSFALEKAPLPTVALFAGLMIGSLPKLFEESRGYGFKREDIPAVIIPFIAIIAVCVVKLFVSAGEADLSAGGWMYPAVAAVAMLASCALVVPGVSGSMLLMILGFYGPVLGLVSALRTDFWNSAAMLALFAAGLVVGFFTIAKLMKLFLTRFPRGTRWAIIGFVLGSVPAIFIVFDYNNSPLDAIQITAAVFAGLLGIIASFAVSAYAAAKSKGAKPDEIAQNSGENSARNDGGENGENHGV